MKHLLKFESFGDSKTDMVKYLCDCGWNMEDLEGMTDEELKAACQETSSIGSITEKRQTKWIKDAIKRPGSLRRKLKKKKNERIPISELDSELQALRGKDLDPDKPGAQLSKRDARKYKQLNLAKTLSKF